MPVKQFEQTVASVDKALLEIVQTDVDLLREASEHIIDSGGKRLRPRLLLLSYLVEVEQENYFYHYQFTKTSLRFKQNIVTF